MGWCIVCPFLATGRLPPDATVESVRSAGRPLPGVALAVVAPAAQGQGEVESAPRLDGSSVLTRGEIGEVVIGGIQVSHRVYRHSKMIILPPGIR